MKRPLLAALLIAVVTCRAEACDPVLLSLIRGQSKSSIFDQAVEGFSTRVNEAATEARTSQWSEALSRWSGLETEWVGLYGKYYLSRSGQAEKGEDWQNTFDSVTKDLTIVEGALKNSDFGRAHPVIRAIQDRLIRFYRQRSPASPATQFDQARHMARTLAQRAATPNEPRAEIGEAYLRLEQEIRQLPGPEGAARSALTSALVACDKELRANSNELPASALRLEQALERYRPLALESLWFSPSNEKGVPK